MFDFFFRKFKRNICVVSSGPPDLELVGLLPERRDRVRGGVHERPLRGARGGRRRRRGPAAGGRRAAGGPVDL